MGSPSDLTRRAWGNAKNIADTVCENVEPFTIPVLVVPEAAVTRCHGKTRQFAHEIGEQDWCETCGSYYDGDRWHRPRILRARRKA